MHLRVTQTSGVCALRSQGSRGTSLGGGASSVPVYRFPDEIDVNCGTTGRGLKSDHGNLMRVIWPVGSEAKFHRTHD